MTEMGILYTAEMDLPDADIEAFLNWYAFRHAADLYQVGFKVCTCYRAVEGDMNILDLYEAPSPDVFTSPEYRRMMPRDPYAAELMVRRRNKAHTVYSQRYAAAQPDCETRVLNADWITLLRFATSEADEEKVAEFIASDEAPRLFGIGAKRVRLAHRTTDHPTNSTFRPRCLLVVEWPERPPEQATPTKRLGDSLGSAFSKMDIFVGYRVYPWPDRKLSSL